MRLTAGSSGPAGVGSTKFKVYTGSAPAKSDTGWQTYDASSKPTVHDGERIAYYSLDAAAPAGNEEGVQHSLALSVDTAAPSTTDDVPAAVQNGDCPVSLHDALPISAGVGSTKFKVYTGSAPAKSDTGWQTYDASSK